MTVETAPIFRQLGLEEIYESPLNPREHFDAKALDELAASIKAVGIITPLIVRPNGGRFEIAAGHRRFRAARLAKLDEVPVVVRDMQDDEFVEVLNIENLQRQDMTALEEAEGYRLLMTRAHYTVDRIAERIGMSPKYVYDRVKLLNLIPGAQELLRQGTITAGHAILLARLNAADQERAIDQDTGGLLTNEEVLENPEADESLVDPVKAVSVREFEAWIDQHVKFDVKTTDPMIFPETAEAVLAADKIVPITHEHFVRPEARDGSRIFGPKSWKRADGERKSKACDRARTAVIVVGPGRGESFKVCIDKKACRVHWAQELKEAARRAAGGASSSSGAADRYEREEEKRRQERAREEAERARFVKARPAILEAIAGAVKKAPTKAGGLLAQIIVDAVTPYRVGKQGPAEYVSRGTSADDLVRHAAFLKLYGEAADDWRAPSELPKRLKAFGLDLKKILDEAAPVKLPVEHEEPAGGAVKKTAATKKRKKK